MFPKDWLKQRLLLTGKMTVIFGQHVLAENRKLCTICIRRPASGRLASGRASQWEQTRAKTGNLTPVCFQHEGVKNYGLVKHRPSRLLLTQAIPRSRSRTFSACRFLPPV